MADLPKDNKEATVIGNDTHIKGEMTFKKSVRLVGSLEGRVVGEGELHVAEGARCKADVESPAVVVDGAIEGNVIARDKVQLNAKNLTDKFYTWGSAAQGDPFTVIGTYSLAF